LVTQDLAKDPIFLDKIKLIQALLRTYLENKRISSNEQSTAKHAKLQEKEIIKAQDQDYVENYQFTNGAKYTGNLVK
jgi:hypothetical protein